MKQVPPRKIKLMMTVILLATGTGGLIMSGVLGGAPIIALLGSVNLAFGAFIGIRYLNSKSEKEKI